MFVHNREAQRSMDKLLAMLAFTRVAEERSITAASARLGLTVSAVAKSLTRLEAELGVKLLTRTTRRINLTDFGREYYAHCVRILADIDASEASLQRAQRSPSGHLRVVTPVSFSRVTLMPKLPEFYQKYPEVTLDIRSSDDVIDLVKQDYDLVVRSGYLEDSRLVSRLLTRGPRVTCASPPYLRCFGVPKHPEDLLRHNCVVSLFGSAWPFQLSDEIVSVDVRGNLQVSNGDALREAALCGIGIVQSNWWTFRHDLASGTLVSLLEDFQVEGTPISILYPPSRYVPLKLRVFIDFLLEITADTANLTDARMPRS